MRTAVHDANDGHPARWARRQSGLHVPSLYADVFGAPVHDAGFAAERLAQVKERAAGRELTDRELRDVQPAQPVRPISGGGSAPTYMVVNGAMPTTAAPASVTTSGAIKTMLQLKPAIRLRIIEWGISFDGSAAATPGKVELIEVDVAATVTAYAAADVFPWADLNAVANTAGTSGTPLNLGTTHSGFTSSGEGTTTASRLFDLQLLPPTAPYVKQFPLNREPDCTVAKFQRIRVTFGTAINAYCYIIFEV